MEFYKIVKHISQYQLEEEVGQAGAVLNNAMLSAIALELDRYYQVQDEKSGRLPLRLRKYMTVYHANGALEYVALTDGALLCDMGQIDGFAHTWLDGEEENRVWFGIDGIVENRGPSAEKVHAVLERLLVALNHMVTE